MATSTNIDRLVELNKQIEGEKENYLRRQRHLMKVAQLKVKKRFVLFKNKQNEAKEIKDRRERFEIFMISFFSFLILIVLKKKRLEEQKKILEKTLEPLKQQIAEAESEKAQLQSLHAKEVKKMEAKKSVVANSATDVANFHGKVEQLEKDLETVEFREATRQRVCHFFRQKKNQAIFLKTSTEYQKMRRRNLKKNETC